MLLAGQENEGCLWGKKENADLRAGGAALLADRG